jgi:hypothetical protein
MSIQKKTKNSYDEIRGMLKTIRTIKESKNPLNVIKEEDERTSLTTDNPDQKSDIIVINDVEVKLMSSDNSDMKLDEKQKNGISSMIDNFRTQVSQIVDFEPGFTITEKQIRLDGTLTDEEISFVFIAGEEGGLYMNADMLEINEEIMTTLNKLVKFEQVFKDGMEPLIIQRQTNV